MNYSYVIKFAEQFSLFVEKMHMYKALHRHVLKYGGLLMVGYEAFVEYIICKAIYVA